MIICCPDFKKFSIISQLLCFGNSIYRTAIDRILLWCSDLFGGQRKKSRQIIIGFLLGLWLVGCTQVGNNAPTKGKPNVVATSTIIADLTKQLAAEKIELKGILQPGADPHLYEPIPADSLALEKAQLILYNGYNLEPGIIKLMNSTGVQVKKVAVGEVAKPLQLDKGKGEIVPDPHVWGDANNVVLIVDKIRDELIELLPEDKEEFTDRAKRLNRELKELNFWIKEQIKTIPAQKRKLVTTHDAFQYYSRAYGLAIAGTLIGISTEEQPSAQTVKKLVDSVKSLGVPAIFAETTINPALIKTVAEEAGVKLAPKQLYSDSIGAVGSDGDSYIRMMVANTRAIVEALGGKYTPFSPSRKTKTA